MMTVCLVILKYDDSMVSYIKEWWQFDEYDSWKDDDGKVSYRCCIPVDKGWWLVVCTSLYNCGWWRKFKLC